MTRAHVGLAATVCAVCLVSAAWLEFGRHGLTAGLVCVAVVAFVMASRWAKVVG